MREKILFDEKWLFHKGDIIPPFPADKGPIYTQSKTERMVWGPASRFYRAVPDDFGMNCELHTEKWEYVNLPHDYIISQKPDKNENNTLGYFKYENAWYRKNFNLPEEDRGKRITLLFEGVATHCCIYLNGCVMKHNFCGYTSFEVDITDTVKFGNEENVIAVYVRTDEHEGWWYEGAGIYRHVWLCKTDTVAVDLWGVYVLPEKKTENEWQVNFETTVINDRYEDVPAKVITTVYEKNKPIAKASAKIQIPFREKAAVKYFAKTQNPVLWDLDNPFLYTAETVVTVNGKECDRYKTRFGFRTYSVDANEGLFLNGRHVKIKGVCAHQDFGLTGKAVADNIHRYKIEMIKEMGANGYRTSHYPHTEAIMDALDELGFIVMAETRWFESTREGKEQLEMLIKRDRNRPSVFFWSIGNEEPHHVTDEGRRICKNLMAFAKKLDKSRPIMSAVSNEPDKATVYGELDMIGINYNLDKYDEIHRQYPNKPVFSSECCATGTTRGWYDDDCPERGMISAYDKDSSNWFLGREKTWKFICERKWVLGGYQWAAFEHRGETVWPRLCSQSGAIDLFLQKKDAFYQNQSHWIEDRPIVHILPHWNFKGRENEIIKVWVYTNLNEIELYLNGKSLGKKQIEKYGHGEWLVAYEPGRLTAEGRKDGKTVCTDEKITSGKAEHLKLRLDNKITDANGRDVAVITCFCTDENGLEVSDASPFVCFNTNSLGKIIGTGSSVADHTPVTSPCRKMYAGRITVAVQVGSTKGELKVYAQSENLSDAVLTIPLK